MAPGRNAPCPCGSTKKYKQCCGAPRAASGISPSDGKASNQVANTEVQEQKKMDDEIDDFQIVSMRSTIAKSIGGAHMKPSENEIQERMRNDPEGDLARSLRATQYGKHSAGMPSSSSTVPFWEQAQRLESLLLEREEQSKRQNEGELLWDIARLIRDEPSVCAEALSKGFVPLLSTHCLEAPLRANRRYVNHADFYDPTAEQPYPAHDVFFSVGHLSRTTPCGTSGFSGRCAFYLLRDVQVPAGLRCVRKA